jgi:methionyl-tRNA formyltransferase
MKVVVFATDPIAIPTINMLLGQQRLGGVVLAEQPDMFSQQLQGWLGQQQIPCARYLSAQPATIGTHMRCWEADLAIAFGFESSLPDAITGKPGYGFYYFHCAAPNQYKGPSALYWLLRGRAEKTQLTLQKSVPGPDSIAVTFDMPIQRLDTLQCLQNNIAQQAPAIINQFIEQLIAAQGQVILSNCIGEPRPAPMPQDSDLYVDWLTMGSEEIAAMARAGNSALGGCVVTLRQTPLSLLQATVVKHPAFGVSPGTICHIGEPEGVIVATCDGALRLDILSNADGIFGGASFTERFQINAGMAFEASPAS